MRCALFLVALLGLGCAGSAPPEGLLPRMKNVRSVRLEGRVVDADTGELLPCRIYVQGPGGKRHFVKSAAPDGSAVQYAKERFDLPEIHTTISAHPFVADLPPGDYRVTVERGKEYFPLERRVKLEYEPVRLKLKLVRWIDMARRGWYSGETHVHRDLKELPNAMLADDLNVAFPIVYWVTEPGKPPKGAGEDGKLIRVDDTHVIWPRNTEYEIFSMGRKNSELGAFFLIGHHKIFKMGVPPVAPPAEQAHGEGALLELDKHAWPWSMCLVPIIKPDLYELTNNHVWRAGFGFRNWGVPAADYMKIERDDRGMTEWGWIDYGLKNYYALLNCGFRLRPTAGTASGVHPVPLGYGRVYVKVEGEFTYLKWLRGLNEGRSFVTTGPMLFTEVEDGAVSAGAVSDRPLDRIEIIVNGRICETIKATNGGSPTNAFVSHAEAKVTAEGSHWIAVRAIEKRGDRVRFAHSAPVFVDVEGKPLRPRREEVEFLIRRVEDEIKRSGDVMPPAGLAEYKKALDVYRKIAETCEP